MIKKIDTESGVISYVLERKNVKNINFRFKPDGVVYISAGSRVPKKYIEDYIIKNSKVIAERLAKVLEAEKNRTAPDDGKFYFLGKVYDTEIIDSDEERAYLDDKLYIYTQGGEDKEELIYDYYDVRIGEIFTDMVKEVYETVKGNGIPLPLQITAKRMKSRWGSCNIGTGTISLNYDLIKYPIRCLRYVALHELAHFRYPNHSREFYGFVEKYMPDYKVSIELLKKPYFSKEVTGFEE